MEISGGTLHTIKGQALIGRALRPVAEIRDELPARQDREQTERHPLRDSRSTVERVRNYASVERDVPRAENLMAYRSYQAVLAYTALERSEEREYVSTVLGVDEYA